jgi:hypothetical protein
MKGWSTKWVSAQLEQSIDIGRRGVKFEVWGASILARMASVSLPLPPQSPR